jgi:hypothetical protein
MARSRRTNRHVRGEKVVVGHATQKKKREALLSASRVSADLRVLRGE